MFVYVTGCCCGCDCIFPVYLSTKDGEWEAPQINNPDCKKAGCGPWSAPMIKNPAYKGKWKVPRIDNPAYRKPFRSIAGTRIYISRDTTVCFLTFLTLTTNPPLTKAAIQPYP